MFKPADLVSDSAGVRAAKGCRDGQAKEYIGQICLMCHQPAMLLSQHRSEQDWKTTVARMATRAFPEQWNNLTIAAYMAKNFGKTEERLKINVNKAKADDLEKVIGLTPDEAKALIGFRDNFARRLPGVGRHAGDLRRRRVEDRSG